MRRIPLPFLKRFNFNESFLTMLIVLVSLGFLFYLNATQPPTVEGISYLQAAQDSLGLRFLLLSIFDVHCVILLFFLGGHSFKVIPSLLRRPSGIIAFGLITASWLLGSALVLLK